MVASAWGAAADADVLALLIDARRKPGSGVSEETEAILDELKESAQTELLRPQQDRLVER